MDSMKYISESFKTVWAVQNYSAFSQTAKVR